MITVIHTSKFSARCPSLTLYPAVVLDYDASDADLGPSDLGLGLELEAERRAQTGNSTSKVGMAMAVSKMITDIIPSATSAFIITTIIMVFIVIIIITIPPLS